MVVSDFEIGHEFFDKDGNLICRLKNKLHPGDYMRIEDFTDWTNKPNAGEIVHPDLSKQLWGD